MTNRFLSASVAIIAFSTISLLSDPVLADRAKVSLYSAADRAWSRDDQAVIVAMPKRNSRVFPVTLTLSNEGKVNSEVMVMAGDSHD